MFQKERKEKKKGRKENVDLLHECILLKKRRRRNGDRDRVPSAEIPAIAIEIEPTSFEY